MQFRKSPIAIAALALFGALPLAAKAGTPYSAVSLPADVPAVNFDKGGEGVAYHELSSANLGGLYRTSEGVDIYASTDTASGPYLVANFQNGEWMQYTVNVPASGNYNLGIRAANNYGTGAFHIEVDGANVTGTISVPKTGSWTTYQWFGKKDVLLSAGTHVVRLVSEQQWFNVSSLSMQAGTPIAATGYGGTPYTGTAVSLPATIPAANFDKGGEGIAFHDLSTGNSGGLYRTTEAVDIYASTDTVGGPYQVASFQTGEWMKYTVNVPANANYDVGIRAANNFGAGAFHIEVDGVNVTGTISVPVTGSWINFQWFGKKGVPLTAGTHVVRLVSDQQWFNVSGLSMLASATTSTTTGSTGTTTGSTGTTTGSTGTTTGSTGTTTGATGTTTGSTGGTTTSAPYSGTAVSLPATIPAANFDKGGEGVAFHDLSTGNLGNLYRTTESVDIYASTDTAGGPYQVASFQTGEWMKYTVKVPANANYDVGIRAANNFGTGAFHIEVDGVNVTGTISVPVTGSWINFQWFGKKGVPLTAGTHVVRVVSDQQWFNVSALSMLASGTTSTTTGSTSTTTTGSTGTTTTGSTSGSTTTTSGSTATKPANLVFWSGFEGAVALQKPTDCYMKGCFQDMSGPDSATGYSWPITLQNGNSRFQLLAHSGTTSTPDTIGSYMYNEIRSDVGPKGNASKVLYTEVTQSGCCGTNAQGGSDTQDALHVLPASEPGDLYISKWMKFQPDLADKLKGSWRVVFEWKEGNDSTGGGAFRAVLGTTYYSGSAPAWEITWDNNANGGLPYQQFYRTNNTSVPVPIGEWFKLEVFWHRAKDNTGRVWFAVNGKVIDDHYGPTIGVNDTPVGRIFINQVYTGAPYPVYQWTDDIQMWKGWPTAKQGDAWYDPPYAPH